MSESANIIVMSVLLGAVSFGIGVLPLFFSFSKRRVACLSTLGTGLLLGAALGIIIPEGIETLLSESDSSDNLSHKIALSLLCGFAFMLLVEQCVSGHSHGHSSEDAQPVLLRSSSSAPDREQFKDSRRDGGEVRNGVSLVQLERNAPEEGSEDEFDDRQTNAQREEAEKKNKKRAFPLTFGLVIHSLADGLALGASALPRASSASATAATPVSSLSFIVFLALIIHKAPTALALSMSLLSTNISRSEHRKHMAAFSAATPFGALASFCLLQLLGSGTGSSWTGIALLVSGGTFLYVATVLQPVSHHEGSTASPSELNEKVRVVLIIVGMFIPAAIGSIFGHEHGS